VCSKHFVRCDIIFGSEKKKLKPNAIPSIFPWLRSDLHKKCSVESQSKNNSEALPAILQQIDDKSICVGSEDVKKENPRTKNDILAQTDDSSIFVELAGLFFLMT
jgi:hypothetical protein